MKMIAKHATNMMKIKCNESHIKEKTYIRLDPLPTLRHQFRSEAGNVSR